MRRPVLMPTIESGFYIDLSARAIDAAETGNPEKVCLDKGYRILCISDNFVIIRSGSWSAMTYTKCSEYKSDTPTPRRLNLVSVSSIVLLEK